MKTNKIDQFLLICKSLKLSPPTKEYKFHETRRWKIDYAWSDIKLAVELEGGAYPFHKLITNKITGKKESKLITSGRHTRGKGFENDLEKYNAMIEQGWTLLRYLPTKINWSQIERLYWLNMEVKKRLYKI
jgi:very-short-patch-repair endonuclease